MSVMTDTTETAIIWTTKGTIVENDYFNRIQAFNQAKEVFEQATRMFNHDMIAAVENCGGYNVVKASDIHHASNVYQKAQHVYKTAVLDHISGRSTAL